MHGRLQRIELKMSGLSEDQAPGRRMACFSNATGYRMGARPNAIRKIEGSNWPEAACQDLMLNDS